MTNLFENRSILVVDDDDEVRMMLREMLRSLDPSIQVREAENGMTCLLAVEEEVPDVVVLDLNMPEMDGHRVIEALRGSERTRDVPILVLTAQDHKFIEIGTLEAGADDFLGKPISQVKFIGRIKTLIRNRDRIMALEGRIRDLSSRLGHAGEPGKKLAKKKNGSRARGVEQKVAAVRKLLRGQVDLDCTDEAARRYASFLDELSRGILVAAAHRTRAAGRETMGDEEIEVTFEPLLRLLKLLSSGESDPGV